MNSDAARFTGGIPQHYDNGLGPMIFVDYADEMARRAAALEPKRVLETAAGTGIVTRRLRDALPARAELTATDLNPPMLDVARAKFTAGEAVTFEPVDATALPYADASFDVVVCQFGLMFFPDKARSYSEVRRVLVPGGHYLFSVWDAHRYNPFARIAHELVGRIFPDDPPQFYRVPVSCHQIDPVKEALIDAGFDEITVSVLRIDKEIPDARAFARGMVYGNPLIDQIRSRGGVEPEAVVDALVDGLHAEFGADPGHMPLQTIFFSARKPA
jgi:SAM-dependent methyltransferase